MMKRMMLLLAIGLSGCEREAPEGTAVSTPQAAPVLPGQEPAKKSAAVVQLPKDPAQLDRMILAGYTPHGSHLHPPGVNECPLTKGSEVVM